MRERRIGVVRGGVPEQFLRGRPDSWVLASQVTDHFLGAGPNRPRPREG
jgi:hypothetical protein